MKLFRRVRSEEADRVLHTGFQNHRGNYLTDSEWEGVWVSSKPLDCNEGVPIKATALLEIDLALSESDIADYEWTEEGKSFREWLVPAALLNTHGKVRLTSDEELDSLEP